MLPQVVAQELEQEVLLQVVAVALAELVVLLQVVVVVLAELVELLQAVVQVLGGPLQEAAQELEECLLRKDLMNLLSHLIFS